MALQDIGREAKKLVVPAAASLAGAGAGLALTRKSVRKAMPDLSNRGIGELTDDLRAKLDSVIGKGESSSHRSQRSGSSQRRRLESRELRQRLDEREQRRNNRRSRS